MEMEDVEGNVENERVDLHNKRNSAVKGSKMGASHVCFKNSVFIFEVRKSC